MLKKIALLVVLFALPLGAMAQKFAHMNSQEVIVVMPEYTKAQADLEAMSKKYTQEMERTQSEFNKKVQEFQQQADSLPRNTSGKTSTWSTTGTRTPRGWLVFLHHSSSPAFWDRCSNLALPCGPEQQRGRFSATLDHQFLSRAGMAYSADGAAGLSPPAPRHRTRSAG